MPNFVVDISEQINDLRQLVGGKRQIVDAQLLSGFTGATQVAGYVEVTGIPQIKANWINVAQSLREKAETRTRLAAAMIAEQSAVEVPFDEGFLQSALRVDEVEDGVGGAFRIDIYYDGSVEGHDGVSVGSYMWLQHERLDYNHPTPGTKAKYLEDPFKQVSAEFPSDLETDLKKVVANPGLGPGTGGPRLRKKI